MAFTYMVTLYNEFGNFIEVDPCRSSHIYVTRTAKINDVKVNYSNTVGHS